MGMMHHNEYEMLNFDDMEEDMYEGGCMEEEYDNTDTLEEVYIVESEDEIQSAIQYYMNYEMRYN